MRFRPVVLYAKIRWFYKKRLIREGGLFLMVFGGVRREQALALRVKGEGSWWSGIYGEVGKGRGMGRRRAKGTPHRLKPKA